MLSCSLSLCSGQSSFLTPPGPSISTGMGSHWLLLLLLLLSRDRAFNLPSRASVWVLASDSSSTSGPLLNGKLSCPSTSSSLPHNMKGQNSKEEPSSPSMTKTSTSKSQDQMTSSTLPAAPQSRSITGPTEEMTPTVHTPVMTITNDMSLSDSTVTSTVKELIGTPQTTVLFSLATSAETPQLSQTPPSSTLDTVSDTNKPLSMTTMTVTITSSPTTATTLGTTVLDTATTEIQEKDTATVPPFPATTPTTSKPPDTHHSTVTQTPSQPAQTASDVSMTPETTTSPPKSTNNTGMGSSVSPSPGDTDRTLTTPSMALSTPEDAIPSSGTGTPSVPEKSALTPPSSTLDTVSDTNKPLSMTTMTVTITSSPSTATTLGTTVLDTATTEIQEKDTATVPPSSATTPTTSKPPDTHHSTVTQTPSQPAQTASDVSMTPETTTSPPKSTTNTGMGSSVSPSPRDTDRTLTTPSMALSTPEDAIPSSGTGTPSVPEKSALTPPSSTLDTVSDTNKPLSMTAMTVKTTSSPTTATTPETTVLDTATTEIQEKDTETVPPSPATTPTTTAIILRSSETTKSSTMTGTNPAPPNSSQSSGVDGGACALDEYPDSTRGCMCNGSHYSHLELSRDIGTLRCRPQDIEVALRSCFLKTHHWVLKDDAFSRCFSINTIEEGRRVQVFQLEKKEGTCGLHISTNVSHALHSLDVHLQQALPGSPSAGFRELHFSCAYPLVVNVSKPVSYQEASIPTIHIPSTGETVITLSIFTDSHLSTPLKNSTAPVGMPLYVVLKSTNSDLGRFALVANEVFASTDLSNTVTKTTYHFVKGSCTVQGRLLQDLSNGASTQVTLAFTLSRFLNSDTLYLHAQVTLCDKQASRPCQPSCSGKNPRRRNSPWASPAKSRLEHGDSKWIVFGPLRISAPRASSNTSGAGAWMSILLLMVIGWMLD